MDLNNLNKGRLNNLQDQETDFDQNAMWANIENRKKRRPVFWWWGAGLGSVLLLVGMFCFFNSDFENNENKSQVTDYQYNTIGGEVSKNEKVNVETIINQKSITQTNLENEIISKKEKQIKSNRKPANFINENQLTRTSSAAEKHLSKTPISNSAEQLFGNQSKSPTQILVEKNENQISNSKVFTSEVVELENDKNDLNLLPLLANKTKFLETEKNENFDLITVQDFKSKKLKTLSWSVSIFGGIGYQQRILESKADIEFSEYLAARKSNETILESWSAGFLIDKKINKKLQVGTGIELVQHNERLTLKDYETKNIEAFSREEVPASVRSQNGFLTKITNNNYQNQIRLVNVPLSVSYFMKTKNIRLAPTASVVFNIAQTTSGEILNELGEETDITPFFKSNIGLGYRLGCRIYYPLNTRYLLFANPQFEINSSDVSSELNPVLQKRNTLRLDIGFSTKI